MTNIVFGTILLAWLLYFCAFIILDVREACRDALLDELWEDE